MTANPAVDNMPVTWLGHDVRIGVVRHKERIITVKDTGFIYCAGAVKLQLGREAAKSHKPAGSAAGEKSQPGTHRDSPPCLTGPAKVHDEIVIILPNDSESTDTS